MAKGEHFPRLLPELQLIPFSLSTSQFPEFGKLLLACIYKQTILMVPYHMKQVAGQSDGDYLR